MTEQEMLFRDWPGGAILQRGNCENCGKEVYQYFDGDTYHRHSRNRICIDERSPQRAALNGWRCGGCRVSYPKESLRDECEYAHASP